MSQSMVMAVAQLLALLLMLMLSFGAWRVWKKIRSQQRIMQYSRHEALRSSPETSNMTSISLNRSAQSKLPLAVLPRSGRPFSQHDIEQVVRQFKLHRYGEGQYYLSSYDKKTPLIVFSAINPQHHFAADQVQGILLDLLLPSPEPASHAVDIFLAVAHQLATFVSGRLCTPISHQVLNDADFENYRRAAREFDLNSHEKR